MDCDQLKEIQVCSHRGNLAKDDLKTKLLTTAGLTKVFDHGFPCADLDLTRYDSVSDKDLVVAHPGDLAKLKGNVSHEAMTFPQLLASLKNHQHRLIALELKTHPVTGEQLKSLLEDLRNAALPWQSTAVWYLPQDISLFRQLHRNQYPEILGIMAMFDRPWRGAPAASNESLDLAATAGIQVLGASIHVSSQLLREGRQRGFQILTFGVNSKDDLIKAVESGVHFAFSDDPVLVLERLMLLRSTRCENGTFHVGMPVGQVLATLALATGLCIGRFSWRKIQVLLILAPLSLSIYLYLCGAG